MMKESSLNSMMGGFREFGIAALHAIRYGAQDAPAVVCSLPTMPRSPLAPAIVYP